MDLSRFYNTFIDMPHNAANTLDLENHFKIEIEFSPDDSNIVGAASYICDNQPLNGSSNILDMTAHVQNVTVPNMILTGSDDIQTMIGSFPTSGVVVEPDSRILTLDILNTKSPVLENVFYPWMKESMLPYWVYEFQPYTTAKITVDMSDHANIKYVFLGCFPSKIQTVDPNMQLNQTFTRNVEIKFQYMLIVPTENKFVEQDVQIQDIGL